MVEFKKRSLYSLPPELKSQPYPWLLISHGKHYQRQTFYSVSQRRYYTKLIPEMCNKKICYGSFGWYLLVDRVSSDNCLLLNLASMETIQLPPLNMKDFTFCILTAPPHDPNSYIVFIHRSYKELMFCHPRDDAEFSKQILDGELRFLGEFRFFECSITIGDKTYCRSGKGKLLTMEFEGSDFRFRQVMVKKEPKTLSRAEHLVEFYGELLLVRKISSLIEFCEWYFCFEVYRLDSDAMEWVEMKSIGNNALFLPSLEYQKQGICCPVTDSQTRRNCIYYSKLQDKNLYVFDLEDQSVTMYLPSPLVKRETSSAYWVTHG
ncbi:hypothetical protein COLO4_31188 [Corchorus olitorius]|uniref:KIB1-4 beta-propeller domain-containing protein n=1 Tax=Corchorus olitorius TaxID=93759 RepID=A0A1R3H571_9ROSI|nr:hypothetical protein COLO4_31188 [Corchorus olitorius]